jgi:hypothetical protein
MKGRESIRSAGREFFRRVDRESSRIAGRESFIIVGREFCDGWHRILHVGGEGIPFLANKEGVLMLERREYFRWAGSGFSC